VGWRSGMEEGWEREGEKERIEKMRIRLLKSAFLLNSLPQSSTSHRYTSDLHSPTKTDICYKCQIKVCKKEN
jgi:hypothetical protein